MPSAGDNLSLAKLGRAVGTSNNYTTQTALAANGRGSTGTETKMSHFDAGAVGSLSLSNSGPGTSASGTATLAFSSQGSLFNSRIRDRNDNFTWSEVDPATALSVTAGDYNTAYSVSPGAPITTGLSVRVIFKEDGQTDGFNDHVTGYNTSKTAAFSYTGGS